VCLGGGIFLEKTWAMFGVCVWGGGGGEGILQPARKDSSPFQRMGYTKEKGPSRALNMVHTDRQQHPSSSLHTAGTAALPQSCRAQPRRLTTWQQQLLLLQEA
jgi:hypothetical protein